jgi:hypothetical protein
LNKKRAIKTDDLSRIVPSFKKMKYTEVFNCASIWMCSQWYCISFQISYLMYTCKEMRHYSIKVCTLSNISYKFTSNMNLTVLSTSWNMFDWSIRYQKAVWLVYQISEGSLIGLSDIRRQFDRCLDYQICVRNW